MPRRKRPWRHLKRLVIHRKSSCRGHPRVRVQFSNETPFYFPLMLWTASPSIVNDVRALIRPNIFSRVAADASELVPQMRGGARGHDVGLTLIFLLLSICIQVGKGWQLARSISSRRKGMLLLPACQAVLPHTDLPSSTEAVIHGWRFLAQLAKVRANILSMSTSRFPKTGIGRRFYSFNLPPNFYAQEFLIFNQKHREQIGRAHV